MGYFNSHRTTRDYYDRGPFKPKTIKLPDLNESFYLADLGQSRIFERLSKGQRAIVQEARVKNDLLESSAACFDSWHLSAPLIG